MRERLELCERSRGSARGRNIFQSLLRRVLLVAVHINNLRFITHQNTALENTEIKGCDDEKVFPWPTYLTVDVQQSSSKIKHCFDDIAEVCRGSAILEEGHIYHSLSLFFYQQDGCSIPLAHTYSKNKKGMF